LRIYHPSRCTSSDLCRLFDIQVICSFVRVFALAKGNHSQHILSAAAFNRVMTPARVADRARIWALIHRICADQSYRMGNPDYWLLHVVYGGLPRGRCFVEGGDAGGLQVDAHVAGGQAHVSLGTNLVRILTRALHSCSRWPDGSYGVWGNELKSRLVARTRITRISW
jgi:hypothetical protein